MKIVISQPMFFPWVGLLEQIRLADVYVHYDDVQFSKGSFTNRVQIKTAAGSQWLTVPLRDLKLGQQIREVALDVKQDWRRRHLETLAQAYAQAPFKDEMLGVVKSVYGTPADTIGELAIASINEVCAYFEIADPSKFLYSSQLDVPGHSTQRVLDVVKLLGGTVYITGHGARNYLDHELFESQGVSVEYMNYQKIPYPQLHGEFTPFVSSLDLIANVGKAGRDFIVSETLYWRGVVNDESNS